MRRSIARTRESWLIVLIIAALVLAAACGDDSEPTSTTTPEPAPVATAAVGSATAAAATPMSEPTATPEPTPTPTATPKPTPTATPEPTPTATPEPTPSAAQVGQLLSAVGQNIATMSTAKLSMIDEMESGAPFFGTTFKRMDAVIKTPDSLRMMVDVEAPGFGFVTIEMIRVGDQAFVKLTKDAPWGPLPPEQVPFNFAGLAELFGNLAAVVQDPTLTGQESVQRAPAVTVQGFVKSEDLADLITSADPGHTVTLTLWIDPEGAVLRQIRLKGQIYDLDDPETSRLIIIEDINVPVEIELPDLTAGR